jgi:hypothetical protein
MFVQDSESSPEVEPQHCDKVEQACPIASSSRPAKKRESLGDFVIRAATKVVNPFKEMLHATKKPWKVLIWSTDPSGEHLLGFQKECDTVSRELRVFKSGHRWLIKAADGGRLTKMTRELDKHNPRILHIIAHRDGNYLYHKDETGRENHSTPRR